MSDKVSVWKDPATGLTWHLRLEEYCHAYTLVKGPDGGPCIPAETEGELVVPKAIDGITVTAIGTEAFRGCSRLTRVTFPNLLTYIGPGAFRDCSRLTHVKWIDENLLWDIPGLSHSRIERDAFRGCVALREFEFPPTDLLNLYPNIFKGCTSLRRVGIPNDARFDETMCDLKAFKEGCFEPITEVFVAYRL